jgi:hypothetical protein
VALKTRAFRTMLGPSPRATARSVGDGIAMKETQQAEQVTDEKPVVKRLRPRHGDEHAYEDSWYQVLRRLAPDEDDG